MTTVPEMTDAEIKKLEATIEKSERTAKEAKEALAKMYEHRKISNIRKVSELISELGLTVDDVASISLVQMAIKKAVKAPLKAPSTSGKGNHAEYVKPAPKWEKDGMQYGGGRGKKPQWVKDAEASGTLDNYLIKA